MSMVVNYERMNRLRPASSTTIPFNINTVSAVMIIITALVLYKRHVNITKSRRRYYT